MSNRFIIKNIDGINHLCDKLTEMLDLSKQEINVVVTDAGRTTKQNNALHSTLSAYAKKLNDAGIAYKIKLGDKEVEGLWTLTNLKDLFKIIARHVYKVTSTADLTTLQIQDCYKVFAERISANTGVYVDWHSNEPPDL